MKKLLGCFLGVMLLFCLSTPAAAIPQLGVAPGVYGDSTLADIFFDGFPMSLDPYHDLSIWYGSDNGTIPYSSDNSIWLLTTSAAGDAFTFEGQDFESRDEFAVASYKAPIYGVNLTADVEPFASWDAFSGKFYSYDFGGGKAFKFLTGELYSPGFEIDDWIYVVLAENIGTLADPIYSFGSNDKSPKTTSTYGAPEPATMLLLGSGLLGFGVFGRKKFKK